MNILDYVEKYGDKDFNEFSFNDVDNLILSQLSYLPLSGIVPSLYEKGITLDDACSNFFKKYSQNDIKKQWYLIPKVSILFKMMSSTKRYGNSILYNYVNIVDSSKQFGALCIRLNDNSVYISYEGTDNTLVGWKEDFKMACNYPVPSQLLAVKYLNRVVRFSDKVIRIGGHSKGGNLAVSAAMGCNFIVRSKIDTIYNNDGPGFLKEQVESKKYLKIISKVKMFVPKESIVGMLLYHDVDYIVVKSSRLGIFQHDAFSWQCSGNSFVIDKLSNRSKNLEKKLNKKLEEMSPLERQTVVEAIFSIFEDNDIKLTKEIKLNKILDILKSIKNTDKEIRKLILDLIKAAFI